MVSNKLYVSYALFMIWVLVMLAFILNGNITFGAGLGDLFFLFLLVAICICMSSVFALRLMGRIKNTKVDIIVIALMVLAVACFTLKFTLLRDAEYRWNGKIFYKQPF